MRLKSLTLKGFKSFPDRTKLDFGPGVSVVVGPNGSGKSNVTDAVLWAMGEQSPLAVRGQSMQDVIFGGGRGVQPRSSAEVEIVLDNADGTVDLPLAEISIVRRLDRSGEGGYTLNGARCRLSDVIEVLSDTGLGKESHSVISQGRVDSIVTSKPRDRRLLIEEAAGLGKHRKRRRRAQLKLERTQENLDRALDVEREARARLRPLKRQSEAAQLHERLELQTLQAQMTLARELVRVRAGELADAERGVAAARTERDQIEAALRETGERRGAAERALGERAERHDARARAAYGARSAHERLAMRAEQVAGAAETLAARIERAERELAGAEAEGGSATGSGDERARITALESSLAALEREREPELEQDSAELRAEHERQAERLAQAEARASEARERLDRAGEQLERARQALAQAERGGELTRRELERVEAELAAVNHYLSTHGQAAGESVPGSALGELLRVRDGYELALAAALGGRLDAVVVDDLPAASAALDGAGADGGSALVDRRSSDRGPDASGQPTPPLPSAQRLLELVSGPPEAIRLAERLLADAWVLDDLRSLPAGFAGIAVTREGRVWFGGAGEMRQLVAGGSERVLARRNERERLSGSRDAAAGACGEAAAEREQAHARLRDAEQEAAAAADGAREADRVCIELAEVHRRTGWMLEQRRQGPAHGELAVRIAEVEGELAAERRLAEQRGRELAERRARLQRARAQLDADRDCAPRAAALAAALQRTAEAVRERLAAFDAELEQDRRDGERMAAELSAWAAQESEIQGRLRAAGEAVTVQEVGAQRLRDQLAEAELELGGIARRLGVDGAPDEAGEPAQPEPLGEDEAAALRERVARLERRREQLGPVNPLAQEEYAEALERVQELEEQRGDLERALRELRGLIRDTDRQIHEAFEQTFAAAAANFEELVGDVFPGGSGRLRLVQEERLPRPVLGGARLDADDADAGEREQAAEAAAEAEADAEQGDAEEEQLPGVEIEITPAGKATKRLSLLSGGEKSMTALAFLFAVFLARPCPFYILDEVEAALDDLNLDRFLALLRRYAERAQFIVITHQKRTMEAADWLYGVSMGSDGVSKVLSRRLPPEEAPARELSDVTGVTDVAEVA